MTHLRPLRRATMSIEFLPSLAEVAVPTPLPLGSRSADAVQTKFNFKRNSSVRVTVVGGGMDAAAHTFFTPLATPSLI